MKKILFFAVLMLTGGMVSAQRYGSPPPHSNSRHHRPEQQRDRIELESFNRSLRDFQNAVNARTYRRLRSIQEDLLFRMEREVQQSKRKYQRDRYEADTDRRYRPYDRDYRNDYQEARVQLSIYDRQLEILQLINRLNREQLSPMTRAAATTGLYEAFGQLMEVDLYNN